VGYQALHSSQAFGQGEHLKASHHSHGSFETVVAQREGQHAAEVAHLSAGDLMTGVILEPRPAHFSHSRVPAEEMCDGGGVSAVALHAKVERFGPS
jgi:hypothetical protein